MALVLFPNCGVAMLRRPLHEGNYEAILKKYRSKIAVEIEIAKKRING